MEGSVEGLRARAPVHFWNFASRARVCAWTLWNAIDDPPDASVIGFRPSTAGALHHGWQRERSFALESIVKAAIAAQRQIAQDKRPPSKTHDVETLWGEAKLPKLNRDDKWRLRKTSQLMDWEGRYATPASLKKDRSQSLETLLPRHMNGWIVGSSPPFGWDEFDRLYQVAEQSFFHSQAQLSGGPLRDGLDKR